MEWLLVFSGGNMTNLLGKKSLIVNVQCHYTLKGRLNHAQLLAVPSLHCIIVLRLALPILAALRTERDEANPGL